MRDSFSIQLLRKYQFLTSNMSSRKFWCLKMCPIHVHLRCWTLSIVLLFLALFEVLLHCLGYLMYPTENNTIWSTKVQLTLGKTCHRTVPEVCQQETRFRFSLASSRRWLLVVTCSNYQQKIITSPSKWHMTAVTY